MANLDKVVGNLEGLTWDDWCEWHSESEVMLIAREAISMLKEQDKKIKSLEQTIEEICCGGQ